MVQIFYEPTGCNCDGTEYTRADITAAADKALSLASESRTLGKDKYPHAYNDYEHFSFPHAQAPYIEFPVMQGKVYSGDAPGADRIVLGSIAEDFGSAVYCAVITHDGQRRNNFAECKDDTMNVRGKGGDLAAKHHGHHQAHGGRKLLERLELN